MLLLLNTGTVGSPQGPAGWSMRPSLWRAMPYFSSVLIICLWLSVFINIIEFSGAANVKESKQLPWPLNVELWDHGVNHKI